jgi:hypothetical protein
MCCYIYFLLIALFMQPAMKAQEQEQVRSQLGVAGAGGGRRGRWRRCSAELAAAGGAGGASSLVATTQPQKERRAPGLLSVRDRLTDIAKPPKRA